MNTFFFLEDIQTSPCIERGQNVEVVIFLINIFPALPLDMSSHNIKVFKQYHDISIGDILMYVFAGVYVEKGRIQSLIKCCTLLVH